MPARHLAAPVLFFIGSTCVTAADASPLLSLNDGERILFLGNGYIENDQWHAYLETRLQRRFPNRELAFRYMGWSGDTVRGNARTSGYQVPEGLARLEKETLAMKPTVVFLAYGMNESFDGPRSLPRFLEDYARLLKTLRPLNARLVLLSPTYHEDLGRPFPDPAEHNQTLGEYTKALKQFAQEHQLLFVDLFHPLESAKKIQPALRLTTNGLLLTQAGYTLAAKAVEDQLGFPPRRWEVHLDKDGRVMQSQDTIVSSAATGAAIRFQATDTMLPAADALEVQTLRITGLAPGGYLLKVGGQEIVRASAARWHEGVSIGKGPMLEDAEKLRAAIVLRNQLFYRRWRPYNDHSRHWGFIGGDFKLYDQEIAPLEKRIAELRKPQPRTYEITAVKQPAPADDISDDPEVARQLMQVPDGFEVQLVASEPAVLNPLQINFDARGRLYVLCAPRYPQILPGQAPTDYVLMLDDFDKNGKARSARVVVDGLMVPTGMMPGDGGIYVGQAESLLHFRDMKGSGKADDKRVLMSGFGTADTHHTLNTFRWGPDGALYFNQGLYTLSTVETPYGPRQLFGGCIWQLRTDRLRLEVYDRSILPNNTWGHAFDAWGQSFVASAWPGALNVVLPDSPLHKTTNQELVPPLKMTQIGGERHCGLEIVSGRHFPDDWQGNLLTGDFLSHRVYRYSLTDDGQRYFAKPLPPLVVSKHRKFRPIDIKMGPDGAVYIADLYQQIIQHNQVDFRDSRRDHTRGRIWRVVRKDRPLLPPPAWADGPIDEIVKQLQAPEQWTRLYAKRALAERDSKAVSPALAKWLERLDPKDTDYPRHLLEGLWAYQAIDHVEPALLTRLFRAEDARVRAAATRVLGAWCDRLPEAVTWLSTLIADPQPRVRLEAIQALCRVPSAQAVTVGMRALDQTVDPFIEFSLRKLAILNKPLWQSEFQAGRLTFDGNARHTAFALKAIGGAAVPTLVGLVVKDKVPQENLAEVLQLIALLGNSDEQTMALRHIVEPSKLSLTDRIRVLDALAQAPREGQTHGRGEVHQIMNLMGHENAGLGSAAIRLAGLWKLEEQRGLLLKWASDPKADLQRRAAAVRALVDLGGPRSLEQVERLMAEDQPYAIRLQAIAGLTILDVHKAASHAGALLGTTPPAAQDPGLLFAAFLERKDGARALAKALEAQPPAADAAKIGLRVLVERGVPAPELDAALQKTLGRGGVKRKLDATEMKGWLARVQSQGDAARGEDVFRRGAVGCLQCHALGGAGGRVGPDLSGIGTSAQLDYLIESVLLPSKVVREGYTTAHVATKDGRFFSGIVKRESARELVLADPLRDEIVIAAGDIEEKRVGGSLMPDGLDQSLTDAELTDLFRFLAELGKPGPFAISHLAVARRWQTLAAPPAPLSTLDAQAAGKLLQEDATLTWKPVYAKVSGHLPLNDMASGTQKHAAWVRCHLEVVTPGNIALRLNDVQGIVVWIDGRILPAQTDLTLDMARGVHTVLVRADPRAGKERGLRLELVTSPGSKGQARFVDGR